MKDSENMHVVMLYDKILKLTIKRNNHSMTRIMVKKGFGLEFDYVKKLLIPNIPSNP